MEGVVYLDNQDRKMIITRSGGLRPQLLADCHVPLDLRFTFYDQVHTTGARGSAESYWLLSVYSLDAGNLKPICFGGGGVRCS